MPAAVKLAKRLGPNPKSTRSKTESASRRCVESMLVRELVGRPRSGSFDVEDTPHSGGTVKAGEGKSPVIMATDAEDPEDLKTKINRLRELVLAEDAIHVRTDDNFMLRYLRCSGYDPENAFKRMKTYYGLKYQHPHWFASPESSPALDEALEGGYFYLLPTKDRDGRFIYVNELGYIKESRSTMPQQSQLHDFYIETILDDECAQKNGICVIIDLKDVSWKLLKWLTPGNLRIAVKKAETLPAKRIAYHVVNPNVVLNMALKAILPCLSSSTKGNIHIHDCSWSSLHRMVDPESLPVSYGGALNPEKHKIKINPKSEKLCVNMGLGYTRNPGGPSSDTRGNGEFN